MPAHDHTTRTPVEEALSTARTQYLAFVRRRIADPDLAEDILQDALLRALRAAPDIDDEERLAAWFYRVLRNAVVDASTAVAKCRAAGANGCARALTSPTPPRRTSASYASVSGRCFRR